MRIHYELICLREFDLVDGKMLLEVDADSANAKLKIEGSSLRWLTLPTAQELLKSWSI
jgi:hypothetical protein